jgi:Membrane proteins related to metalloendopeptidases
MIRGTLTLVLLLLLPPTPTAVWTWPTEGEHRILRDFRAPSTPWGPGHRGLDLAAAGDNIVAPTGGVISFSGDVAGRGVLTLQTPEGVLISMEPVEALVSTGDRVSRGELIATLHPGHCAQLCVHLGLREGGDYRSARRELGVLQRSVLLPLGDYARG